MTPTDHSGPSVIAEGGRWVADAVSSAVLGVAEAVRPPPRDAAPPPRDAAPPGPRPTEDHEGGGAIESLVSWPSRAATDAVTAIAAAAVPAVVERLDLNAVLAKVDVDALVARVDLDRVLDSIEPNRLLERVDVDALVARVDVAAVASEALEGIDIGEVIQESTAGILSDTIEAARGQAMRADDALARAVDWVLRRPGPRDSPVPDPGGR